MDAFDASTKEVLPSEFIQMGMSSPGISFVSGTQVLVDTLHEELSAQDNTEVLMNAPVTAVEPCGDTTLVTAAGGSPEEYTHVFSTLAAPDLSDVLPNSCSVARCVVQRCPSAHCRACCAVGYTCLTRVWPRNWLHGAARS